MEKKIRFGDLVRESGRPQTHTLWTDAKHDKQLQQAIKKNQVVTVIQEPTSNKKDFGRIGFHEQPGASYLIFPRSLKTDDNDARIIGLNYQLIEEPIVKNPVKLSEIKLPKVKPKTHVPKAEATEKPEVEAPKPPPRKNFSFTIKRTATLETKVDVEAENKAAAKEQAMKLVKEQPFSIEKAEIEDRIAKIQEHL